MKLQPVCVVCGRGYLIPFLDLGHQPLANAFHVPSEVPKTYPLTVTHCTECGHKQLACSIPPDYIFRNYPYRSGVSQELRCHFRELASDIRHRFGSCRVLDIACNDGTFLEELERVGIEAVGIDPARNLIEIAQEKGLNAHCGYWVADTAKEVGRFDVITALNVIAHTDNPFQFLLNCREGLNPGGRIILQTSQADWIENAEFDCVYHEHISYFTESSMARLAHRAGMEIERTEYYPIHGRSRRTVLTDPLGLCRHSVKSQCETARERAEELRSKGYALWGYGAAAKGNVRLNTAGIRMDAIADDTPEKQGLFAAGNHTPIVSPEGMREIPKLAIVILAWNWQKEIVGKIRTLRAGKETVILDARNWQEVGA